MTSINAQAGAGPAATVAPNAGASRGGAVGPGFIRWRFALLNLIAVYPLITVLLYVLMPTTEGWQMWQRTLLLAPLMIVSIVYGIGPFLHKHFGWFLRPQAPR